MYRAMVSHSRTVASIRTDVALGCRVLASHGHDDFVWGHASVRDPEGRGVWMKAAALGLEEITENDVLLVDWDGEVLDGSGRRHSEWPIHTEIMAARPDVRAVVHSHPPHSIALAAAGERLRPLSHAGTLFVPPDVPRFEKTADLITTRELGQDVAASLADQSALFLVNHGIVTAGSGLPDAVIRAILLEKACHQQLITHGFGGWATWPPPEEARAKRASVWAEHHMEMLWEYLVRRLEQPESR
jgi:ribulose-5-phosphate 4-epimerase/fuculose-1-phosphate aldolase